MSNEDNQFQDWKAQMEKRQREYGRECQEELKDMGMEVTPEQAIIILQPSHGPENFYCDGEISHEQAMENWMRRLKNSGLSPTEMHKAKKLIFG